VRRSCFAAAATSVAATPLAITTASGPFSHTAAVAPFTIATASGSFTHTAAFSTATTRAFTVTIAASVPAIVAIAAAFASAVSIAAAFASVPARLEWRTDE
jgi:hypothetical protein